MDGVVAPVTESVTPTISLSSDEALGLIEFGIAIHEYLTVK